MIFQLNEGPDYKQLEVDKRNENLNQILKIREDYCAGIQSYDVIKFMEKVDLYCQDYGYTVAEIINELPTNRHLQIHLMKSPKKQNIYEPAAFKCLQDLKLFDSIYNLPNGGKSAYSLTKHGICKGVVANDDVKTIDFMGEINVKGTQEKKTFVFAHKYTQSLGGSQDNQFLDAKKFLDRGIDCANNELIVIAILDGPYYQIPYTKGEAYYDNKLNFLNEMCHTKNHYVYATDIFHIKDVINHYLNNIPF